MSERGDGGPTWVHDASPYKLPDGSFRASCICGWVGGRYSQESACRVSAVDHINWEHKRRAARAASSTEPE